VTEAGFPAEPERTDWGAVMNGVAGVGMMATFCEALLLQLVPPVTVVNVQTCGLTLTLWVFLKIHVDCQVARARVTSLGRRIHFVDEKSHLSCVNSINSISPAAKGTSSKP